MAGQYPHVPHGMPYYNINPAGQPMMPLEQYAPRLQHVQTLSSEHLNHAYADFEQNVPLQPVAGTARSRRRTSAGGEQVKHRRTRSGCYTCRNRRVKCDEKHPICDRCRKGNRDCVYPEPSSTSKSSRSSSKSKTSPKESVSSGEEGDGESKDPLPTIPDDEDSPTVDQSSQPHQAGAQYASHSRREQSDTPSLTHDKSPSPSGTDSASITSQHRASISRASSRSTAKRPIGTRTWAELPQKIQFYLNYHRNHLSHHHYAFKNDSADFMRTTFLEIAMRNEPLLYAVVGFAAYFHTLTKPDGRLQDFLGFYNQSVQLLRKSIQRTQKHTVATLLTILQLATFEEYLGDWVNLVGHQKAAYEIIKDQYTPQTIMQNETLRRIITWYTRFDIYAGIISASGTTLAREWFDALHKYYAQQRRDRPSDLGAKLEERLCYNRLVGVDMASTFSKRAQGLLSDAAFEAECAALDQQLVDWESALDLSMLDPSKVVRDFSDAPPPDPDDIVDPFEPGLVYGDDLWPINLILLDYWALKVTYRYRLAMSQGRKPSDEIVRLAYKVCQVFEALEMCSNAPPGILIDGQACLGMCTMLLPQDRRHIMWTRRKFAKIESQGYIFPATFRNKRSEAWGESNLDWWLPNMEGCPPLVQTVRNFIEERTLAPRDQTAEDLREMKGIFHSLNLDDTPSPSSSSGRGRLPEIDAASISSQQGLEMGMVPLDETMIYGDSPDYMWNFERDPYMAQ